MQLTICHYKCVLSKTPAYTWQRQKPGLGLDLKKEYPTLVKHFGLTWLEAEEHSNHVLWMRWNLSNRLHFLERWESTLAILDRKGLVKPKIVQMMKNPGQFLDTIAQVKVAAELVIRGFRIELEANKSGRTPDIFLIQEAVCIEVKNLHLDPRLVEQTLSGENRVVEMRDRLPSAVEEKYVQLPEGYRNILILLAAADVQFDEFQDFFIDIPVTLRKGQPLRFCPW